MKRLTYTLAIIGLIVVTALVTAQISQARATDTLTKLEVLKDDGSVFSPSLSPNIFTGRIEYENASCFFLATQEFMTRLESLNQITPLGCVSK